MPNLRIMLVEDDADTREFMVGILTLYGYQVITWWNGPGAVAQIQQHQPDMVVLDHRLPLAPIGWEIFVALRAEPATMHIPVLLYSSEHMVLRQHHDQIRSMRGDVLQKPFNVEELLEKIEELMSIVTK